MSKKIKDKVLADMLSGVHFAEADMAGQIKARAEKPKAKKVMSKTDKDKVVEALDGLIAGLKEKLVEIGNQEVAPGVTAKMYAFMGHSCDTDESPMEGEVGFVAPKEGDKTKTKLSIRLKKNTPVGVMVQAVLSGMAGFIKDAGKEHGLELTDQEIRGAMHYVVDKMEIDSGQFED